MSLFNFNLFPVDIFDGSEKTTKVRMQISASYSNDDTFNPLLKHVVSHLDINMEDDCEVVIKGLNRHYGRRSFEFAMEEVTRISSVMAEFIHNGTNLSVAENCECRFEFMINQLGLMENRINFDVFAYFVTKRRQMTVGKALITIAKKFIKPLTTDNMYLVTKMMEIIKNEPTLSDEAKNHLLVSIIE